jgi:hypothetical protein
VDTDNSRDDDSTCDTIILAVLKMVTMMTMTSTTCMYACLEGHSYGDDFEMYACLEGHSDCNDFRMYVCLEGHSCSDDFVSTTSSTDNDDDDDDRGHDCVIDTYNFEDDGSANSDDGKSSNGK